MFSKRENKVRDDTKNEHINQLNNETGKLTWKELEPHFARGAVIKVAIELDLVNIATTFIQDNKAQVEAWLATGQVTRANEEDARRWELAATLSTSTNKDQQTFWAIVTAPWILVQEIVEQ